MMPSSHITATRYYKKALIAVCLGFALCCACDGAWGGSTGDIPGREPGVRVQETEIADCAEKRPGGSASEETFEQFGDFIVRLKDDHKKDRILVCAVVMQLSQGMRLPKERIQLRKIIYKTLQERSDLSEIREELREEIKTRLNAFMGGERVSNIYFTKFVLL
jgi:flagellar basal body-associated protein FliL